MANQGSQDRSREGDSDQFDPAAEHVGKLQWAVACFGAAVFFGVLGFIGYSAVIAQNASARLSSIVDGIDAIPGGYAVRFRISNDGSATAAEVQVRGTLADGRTVLEESEVTLSYIPPGSEREASLVFDRDPHDHTVRIQPRSYREP